jgi:hypothetical protein
MALLVELVLPAKKNIFNSDKQNVVIHEVRNYTLKSFITFTTGRRLYFLVFSKQLKFLFKYFQFS